MIKHKWQFFALGLLVGCLIVSCQISPVRQNSRSQPLSNCRTLQHALGQVCVPQSPADVISLEETTFADAIALGVTPIGTAKYEDKALDYLDKVSSQFLGHSDQLNLEKILTLNPDLILGIEFTGKPIFKQLSQIAPTALGPWQGLPSWREHFNFVANVLGKEKEAKNVWARYDQKIADSKAVLDEQLKDKRVSIAYAYGDSINIDAENSFAGSILADIGIRQPDNHAAVEDGRITLSEERIPEIDADILFIGVYNQEAQETLERWQQKPLWANLRAVQAAQVYVVDANIWRAGTPIAAHLVIDDLFKYLVNQR